MEAKFLETEELDRFNSTRTNFFDLKAQIADIAIID
jgi:hypothetical protein